MQLPDPLFPALHCSLGAHLGHYYQDLRAAVNLVEAGYHGPLDSVGVPRVLVGGKLRFNTTLVAQYALANASLVLDGNLERTKRLRDSLDVLVEHQEAKGATAGLWLYDYDHPRYRWLLAPWASAMAQGNAISALLRGAEILGETKYEDAALAASAALRQFGKQSGTFRSPEALWYEEYPSQPPLHTLNGHIYALLGVLDTARFTGSYEEWRDFEAAARTVTERITGYDLGFWSAYDLGEREPVSVHYHQNIHIPQLEILAELLNSETLRSTAAGWQRYLVSWPARVCWFLALRLHGLKRRLGLYPKRQRVH